MSYWSKNKHFSFINIIRNWAKLLVLHTIQITCSSEICLRLLFTLQILSHNWTQSVLPRGKTKAREYTSNLVLSNTLRAEKFAASSETILTGTKALHITKCKVLLTAKATLSKVCFQRTQKANPAREEISTLSKLNLFLFLLPQLCRIWKFLLSQSNKINLLQTQLQPLLWDHKALQCYTKFIAEGREENPWISDISFTHRHFSHLWNTVVQIKCLEWTITVILQNTLQSLKLLIWCTQKCCIYFLAT